MIEHRNDLRRHATPDEVQYLAKKIVGGDSSREGLIFEERVAAYHIVEQVSRVKSGALDLSDVEVVLQARTFVDDVALAVKGLVLWIEAKSGAVGWGSAAQDVVLDGSEPRKKRKRTVAQNFRSQMRIDECEGRLGRYILAVTSQDKAGDLSTGRANVGLQAVELFVLPNGNQIAQIEQIHKGFRDRLKQLCPLTHSDRDLENVLWAIMTSLRKLDSGAMANLADVSLEADEQYKGVLSMGRDLRLHPEVERILLAIGKSEDFKFAVCGTTLHYVYDGDHGTGKFTVGSKSGIGFEEDVLNMSSASFDDLLPLLRKRR